MTTTTTTMMASIDIPCNDGEVGATAASEEDVGMATTQAQTGSSFTLGDKQDRVLMIDAGNVKITSISVPEKHVTLTTKVGLASCRFARRSTSKREKSIVRRIRWLIMHTLANYTTCS